jgi:hypothetical protein
MSRIFLVVLLFVSSELSYAQFPEAWIGKYSGTMYLNSLNSPKDSVVVTLEIIEIIKDSAWTYTMGYKSEKFGDILKNYKILKVTNENSTDYLMDENNGIFLEMTFFDNTFYEYFEVENMLYSTRLLKRLNFIEFEIVGTQNEATKTCLSVPQEEEENIQYEVKSYKPLFAQKVLLKPIQ